MGMKMVGKGSQYPWDAQDSNGTPFDGAKTYKLRLRDIFSDSPKSSRETVDPSNLAQ